MSLKKEKWRSISGEYYDWTKTLQPEQPYIHDYSQTLTMKLAMSVPDENGGSTVFCNFEQALRYIQETDRLTRGIPKIIYLVGWQYNGHDDKYPAWDEINPHLKRSEDLSARDSYLWLIEEAKRYNTTVSVHVNMTDAYEDSPHWKTYIEHDFISRNEDHSLIQIGNYNNKPAYQICYKNEWEHGFTVRRIEKLISLLDLEQVGTVHLDAYFPRDNKLRGISQEEESSYMRRTFRYFRERGIDVTSECFTHLRNDPFIGLQPWCWWFDQVDEKQFMERPANLLSGAVIRDYSLPGIPIREDLEFLYGAGMHGEDIYLDFERHVPRNDWHSMFLESFCLKMLPYQYLNSLERVRLEGEGDQRVMHYFGGVSLHWSDRSMYQDGKRIRQYNDLLIPALWRSSPELIAYSKEGYASKRWALPTAWEKVESVNIYQMDQNGLSLIETAKPVVEGYLELQLAAGMAVSILPSNRDD